MKVPDERQAIVVTGGAGFIGSALCRHLVRHGGYRVINVDKLTYSSSLEALRDIEDSPFYTFRQADIGDRSGMLGLLREQRIDRIVHLAAESHVDRSIDGPAIFLDTNVMGTFHLLEAALAYWRELEPDHAERFRFHHVSTDEVFGDLPYDTGMFTEESPYAPSSPYSASKAASDHLVRAWHSTYGLPVVLSHCSNNYGPFQFPEKLIPLAILNALEGKPLPIYGDGANIRDWLFVDDHARALELVMTSGAVGQGYNVGARNERTNLSVVESICDLLDERRPLLGGRIRRDLITFVQDRPGHDRRYAIDPSKIERELGWRAQESFETGLVKTIDWFLENGSWWRPIRESKYAGARLGAG